MALGGVDEKLGDARLDRPREQRFHPLLDGELVLSEHREQPHREVRAIGDEVAERADGKPERLHAVGRAGLRAERPVDERLFADELPRPAVRERQLAVGRADSHDPHPARPDDVQMRGLVRLPVKRGPPVVEEHPTDVEQHVAIVGADGAEDRRAGQDPLPRLPCVEIFPPACAMNRHDSHCDH